MKALRWLIASLVGIAVLLFLLLVFVFAIPDWDERDHRNLDTNSALRLARSEQLRVARKHGQTGPDEHLIGRPCLVSQSESAKHKHYVFEFHRDGIEPAVMSVYVDSAPDQLEANATGKEAYSSWSDPVRNCGQ